MEGVQRIIVVYRLANLVSHLTEDSLAAASNKPNRVPKIMEDPATKNVILKNGNNTGIAFQM